MLVIQTKIVIKYTVKFVKYQYIGNLNIISKLIRKILQYYYSKGGFAIGMYEMFMLGQHLHTNHPSILRDDYMLSVRNAHLVRP